MDIDQFTEKEHQRKHEIAKLRVIVRGAVIVALSTLGSITYCVSIEAAPHQTQRDCPDPEKICLKAREINGYTCSYLKEHGKLQ